METQHRRHQRGVVIELHPDVSYRQQRIVYLCCYSHQQCRIYFGYIKQQRIDTELHGTRKHRRTYRIGLDALRQHVVDNQRHMGGITYPVVHLPMEKQQLEHIERYVVDLHHGCR
jgi:hypothetical protein